MRSNLAIDFAPFVIVLNHWKAGYVDSQLFFMENNTPFDVPFNDRHYISAQQLILWPQTSLFFTAEHQLLYNLFRGIIGTSDLDLLEHSIFNQAGIMLDDYLSIKPAYVLERASYRDLLNIAMQAAIDDRLELEGLLTRENCIPYATYN